MIIYIGFLSAVREKREIMKIMEEVTRQRVDCFLLPVFAKLLSRHFSVKVANTLSLEIE